MKIKIIWTRHAKEHQEEWHKKLGITRQEVENLLRDPEQVVPGDLDAFVAQTRRGKGLLRVPFVETERGRKILTILLDQQGGKVLAGGKRCESDMILKPTSFYSSYGNCLRWTQWKNPGG